MVSPEIERDHGFRRWYMRELVDGCSGDPPGTKVDNATTGRQCYATMMSF